MFVIVLSWFNRKGVLKMSKIQKVATVYVRVMEVFMVCFIFLFMAFNLHNMGGNLGIEISFNSSESPVHSYSFIAKSLYLAGAVPIALAFLGSLFLMRRILKRVSKADYFSFKNAKDVGYIGSILVCKALVLMPLEEAMNSISTSWDLGEGARLLKIVMGTPNLETLLYAGVLFVGSLLLKEAALMREEQILTV